MYTDLKKFSQNLLLASSLLIQVAYGMDNQVETEGEDFIQNKITQNKNIENKKTLENVKKLIKYK